MKILSKIFIFAVKSWKFLSKNVEPPRHQFIICNYILALASFFSFNENLIEIWRCIYLDDTHEQVFQNKKESLPFPFESITKRKNSNNWTYVEYLYWLDSLSTMSLIKLEMRVVKSCAYVFKHKARKNSIKMKVYYGYCF